MASRLADLSITAIVLTHNEELHIARCLKSAGEAASRIIVVDSFSSDRTADIARSLGAEVYRRAFRHQADQLQWAIANCAISTAWVLRLDADEYMEPELIREIRRRLPGLPPAVTGVKLKRKLIFRGTWIRFGGYYPAVLLRLWRTGKADVPQVWMDEHVRLKDGRSITFEHDICDHSLHDITRWTEKHNRYATRKMADIIAIELGLRGSDGLRPTRQVYWRAPLYLRSVLYFLYRYIVRLGFLDGRSGFVWHALQGLWYHLLIDAKIADARAYIRNHGIDAFKAHLASRHGIEL